MAAKAKAKKPPRGAGKHPKKKKALHRRKAPAHAKKAAHHEHAPPRKPRAPTKHAAPPKHPTPIKHAAHRKHSIAEKPIDVRVDSPQPVLARKRLPRREFFVAAAPATRAALPIKKKKKKPEMVLRFTENTLKDIAALECVRRCFTS